VITYDHCSRAKRRPNHREEVPCPLPAGLLEKRIKQWRYTGTGRDEISDLRGVGVVPSRVYRVPGASFVMSERSVTEAARR
jgi:hypothetical protein